MTLQKAERFQSDLRKLFSSYGITSGCALFMHDGTLHPIESHVTEKNALIVSLMDGLTTAAKEGTDIPVWEYWTQNNSN